MQDEVDGALEHPGADGVDEAQLFRHRNELVRGDLPAGGVAPAQQGFGLAHRTAGQVQDGLEVQRQLAFGEGAAQVLAELQALQGVLLHGRGEVTEAVPAGVFGVIHGLVGVLQDVGGGVGVLGEKGDADARRDVGQVVAQAEGVVDGGNDGLGDALHGVAVGEPRQQHGELVTALAGHGVGFAHAADDAPRSLHQQLVASLVSEGVIDLLEAVQVDVQHGHAVVVPVGLLHQFAEPVVKQTAVGQAGEGVVVGLHPHQGFGLLAFGDVGDDPHQPPHAAVRAEPGGLVEDDVPAHAVGGFH